MTKHLINLFQLDDSIFNDLLILAQQFKNNQVVVDRARFRTKSIILLFSLPSTRTRCDLEVAAHQLGLRVTFIGGTSHMGVKESFADTARILSDLYDLIIVRTYHHDHFQQLANNSKAPVVNALTHQFHPLQGLADVFTIKNHFQNFKTQFLKIVFLGDCQSNVAISLMIACVRQGWKFVACGPQTKWPSPKIQQAVQILAQKTNAKLMVTTDITTATTGAHVIYTDVWTSMGQDKTSLKTDIQQLQPYQVNAQIMSRAHPKAIFMHCLPAFHDQNTVFFQKVQQNYQLSISEVTDQVFQSKQSIVFRQAHNRLFIMKAVLFYFLTHS